MQLLNSHDCIERCRREYLLSKLNCEIWDKGKQGQDCDQYPELGAGEQEPDLSIELRLEERRQRVVVTQDNDDVVEHKANEAGDCCYRVPEGCLQEQLVDNNVDDY